MSTPDNMASEMSIDELVRNVSAFSSFSDLEKSMRENGYVPTLNCKPLRTLSKKQRIRQAQVNELAHRLTSLGLSNYRGNRPYRGKTGHQ